MLQMCQKIRISMCSPCFNMIISHNAKHPFFVALLTHCVVRFFLHHESIKLPFRVCQHWGQYRWRCSKSEWRKIQQNENVPVTNQTASPVNVKHDLVMSLGLRLKTLYLEGWADFLWGVHAITVHSWTWMQGSVNRTSVAFKKASAREAPSSCFSPHWFFTQFFDALPHFLLTRNPAIHVKWWKQQTVLGTVSPQLYGQSCDPGSPFWGRCSGQEI